MRIILASQSPRRIEILKLMNLKFEAIASNKEEDMTKKMTMPKLSESLAEQKALDIFTNTTGDRVVIGSDTMVYLGNHRFGKPKSKEDAFLMLKTLSSKWHNVITSLCVYIERAGTVKKYLLHDITKVKFCKLSDETINKYLLYDEYKDKAGAYAIQGMSGMFVEKIKGSYFTVIGLPGHLLFDILLKEGII